MEHAMEHREHEANGGVAVQNRVDIGVGDSVTVAGCAPGANGPECGSLPGTKAAISKFGHGGARANSGGRRANAGRRKAVNWAAVVPPRVEGGRWHVVEFAPGRELLVINQLQAFGFEVLMPLYRPAPRPGPDGKLQPSVLRPALGRYLLVRFDQAAPDWRRIPGMLGVLRLLSHDAERPMVVADAVVARLRERFGEDGSETQCRDRAPPAPLPAGSSVRVIAGLLAGHVGTGVVDWCSGGECRVLFAGRGVVMAQVALETV
jgi:hypothetical protein